jgi:tetratricopeptide (TPR) repeat protein
MLGQPDFASSALRLPVIFVGTSSSHVAGMTCAHLSQGSEGRTVIRNSPRLSVAGIPLLLVCLCVPIGAAANPREEAICDATADHYLVGENYPEAIRVHREFLRAHPADALAHYHLGFAEGMAGDKAEELKEYQRAAALGLSRSDLFLNTGLALLENGKLEPATDALRLAVRLDPTQPESHYNLGLIYERRDMLAEAEQEMLVALRLEPEQLDARNMLGVIYARQGKTARASLQWRDLLHDAPDYTPARTNLTMLAGKQAGPSDDTQARLNYGPPIDSHEYRRLRLAHHTPGQAGALPQ